MQRRHQTIRSLEKHYPRPSAYGNQVWRSSFTLMSYLEANPLAPGSRVVEVGCGWGLAGIFCAKRFDAEVLLTDMDQNVFPYARAHESLNNVQVRTECTEMERLSDQRLAATDVLLGGDVCFWPELGSALRTLITRSLDQGVQQVVLADPGRSTFVHLADYCQKRFPTELIRWHAETRAKSETFVLVVG